MHGFVVENVDLAVDQTEHVVKGDMKSLKLSKMFVRGKWRQLIRGTALLRRIVAIAGLMCPTVSGSSSPRLSWIKEL